MAFLMFITIASRSCEDEQLTARQLQKSVGRALLSNISNNTLPKISVGARDLLNAPLRHRLLAGREGSRQRFPLLGWPQEEAEALSASRWVPDSA